MNVITERYQAHLICRLRFYSSIYQYWSSLKKKKEEDFIATTDNDLFVGGIMHLLVQIFLPLFASFICVAFHYICEIY